MLYRPIIGPDYRVRVARQLRVSFRPTVLQRKLMISRSSQSDTEGRHKKTGIEAGFF
ncbi:hypothetical protein Thiosp_00823 [Thiorhodovibrio litoralis]|nr:hypothetical protein Thiosp_00823 [Thiorhodovibrio litoralis]